MPGAETNNQENPAGVTVDEILAESGTSFEENIPFISRIVFEFTRSLESNVTREFPFDGDKTHMNVQLSDWAKGCCTSADSDDAPSRADLLSEIAKLHIGQWQASYYAPVLDGEGWNLEFYYSDDRESVKIDGSNAYPDNFNDLRSLLEIDIEGSGK